MWFPLCPTRRDSSHFAMFHFSSFRISFIPIRPLIFHWTFLFVPSTSTSDFYALYFRDGPKISGLALLATYAKLNTINFMKNRENFFKKLKGQCPECLFLWWKPFENENRSVLIIFVPLFGHDSLILG